MKTTMLVVMPLQKYSTKHLRVDMEMELGGLFAWEWLVSPYFSVV
jgi:hypothetical protein